VYVVLVSGSTRAGSTNTAALRTVAELDVPGVVATLWERLVDVPAFVPDDEAEPPAAVTALRLLLASADAVVFCTPEYAGTLPGSFKNAIDWLVGSGELYRTPVAWINVGTPGPGSRRRGDAGDGAGVRGRRRHRARLRADPGRARRRRARRHRRRPRRAVPGSRPSWLPSPSTSGRGRTARDRDPGARAGLRAPRRAPHRF
jgi:hypothetical protein